MRRRELLKTAAASFLPKNPINAIASVLNGTSTALLDNINLAKNPKLIGSAEDISEALAFMFDIEGIKPRHMKKVNGKVVVDFKNNEWVNSIIPSGVYDPEYLAANWFNSYIKTLKKTGSLSLLFRTMYGDATQITDEWLNGAVSQFTKNLVEFLSPKILETYVRRASSMSGQIDQELYLTTMANISDMSPIFAKVFPYDTLQNLRTASHREFIDYFRKAKKIDIEPGDDYSSDDITASTHGGFAPGQSQYYDKGRMFENLNPQTTAYKLLIDTLKS